MLYLLNEGDDTMSVDAGYGNGSGARAPRQQLSDEVATYVRELIVSGEVRPGEFLRLEPIAEAVGVSNTPVREGLLALRSEGFVRLVPRRGFVVAPFSAQDVRDLFWAQAQLAGELAARAAEKITPEQLTELEQIVEMHRKAVKDGNNEAIARMGHNFHRAVNMAADSQRLALLLGSVVKHLPNRFYAAIEGQVSSSLEEHPHIIEALRSRDTEKAREIMSKHVFDGADRLVATLEERNVWGQASNTA
jgi:DNA-binding GntR family transcriptional regulator